MDAQTFNGPRLGKDAHPDRNGTEVTTSECQCLTCRDLGPWLNEPHCVITFTADGVSIGHAPARWGA